MYEHIFSPVTINGITLKSRLTHTKSGGGVDGSEESFQKATRYFTNIAKNGAALVCMIVGSWPDCEGKRSVMSRLFMDDPQVQAGFTRMIGEVHKYGTLCTASLMNVEPQELNISHLDHWNFDWKGDYNPNFKNKPEISPARIDGMIDDFVFQCRELQRIGFDGVTFYMSYRASILANAISPVLNQRKDQWGGNTLEERARLPLTVFRRVKEACGQNFLIEIQTSAEEEQPGYDVEYWLDFCQMCEGLVDIFQIRGWDGSYTHVGGYNSTKESPWNLQFAEKFKARGIKALCAPVGGFGDPDTMEQFLAEGRTDLIAMARQYYADTSFGIKLQEGRGADVTPCLRCMGKCDSPSCAVNPYSMLLQNPGLFPATKGSKKVAVIGGGPAGVRAALAADERGHQVTIYEKSDALGGQAKFAVYPDFKWNLRDYLYWMRRQVAQSGCQVRLNTLATPEQIKSEGYDAVILALGSEAKTIPVQGAELPGVLTIDQVYENPDAIGQRVVLVGGGASGKETALYLARTGRQVTLLTRKQAVFAENNHCIYAVQHIFETEPNLTVVEFADTKEIGSRYVVAEVKTNMPQRKLTFQGVKEMLETHVEEPPHIPGFQYPVYPDLTQQMGPPPELMKEDGGMPKPPGLGMGFAHDPEEIQQIDEKDILREIIRFDCDTVIVSGGRQSRTEAAAAFQGCAPEIYVIGDNVKPGSIQECTLTGFAAAMAL